MAIEVEQINITGNVARKVDLTFTPLNPTEVSVDPIGGPAQVYGVDFQIIGTKTLEWDLPNSDIKTIVEDIRAFDVELRIIYERA